LLQNKEGGKARWKGRDRGGVLKLRGGIRLQSGKLSEKRARGAARPALITKKTCWVKKNQEEITITKSRGAKDDNLSLWA